jgi:FAD/FMN-containing dehydrogenase
MLDFPRFEGELRQDEEALAAAAVDFGHIVQQRPTAVLRVASAEDVALAIRFARERGMRVVARGQGHTTGGQALRRDALVLDLGALRHIEPARRDERGGSVRCGAAARWVDVLRSTLGAGLTPPVLTDYIGLSVGGTLSVGGIGGQSFRHGLQVDRVRRLRIVTGDGEVREASPAEQSALFDGARAGLGRLGVIVDVELDLVPAPTTVRVRHLPYADVETFLRDQEKLIEGDRFGYVLGNIPAVGGSWGFSIEVVEHVFAGDSRDVAPIDDLACDGASVESTEMEYFAYANRLEAMERAMRAQGTWLSAHPWLDVFLPASWAASFIREVLSEVRPADVGDGYVMTYPVRKIASKAPLLRLPSEPHSFLFDVLSNAAAADVPRWIERLDRFGRAALERGGSVYPIGSMRMTPALWQMQLGEEAATLRELVRRFDPAGILGGSGVEV